MYNLNKRWSRYLRLIAIGLAIGWGLTSVASAQLVNAPDVETLNMAQSGEQATLEAFLSRNIGSTYELDHIFEQDEGSLYTATITEKDTICLVSDTEYGMTLDCESLAREPGQQPLLTFWTNRPEDPNYFAGRVSADISTVYIGDKAITPRNGFIFGSTDSNTWSADFLDSRGTTATFDLSPEPAVHLELERLKES